MKWFRKYIGSLPGAIKWLFGISLVFVAAYDFALKDLPEMLGGQTEPGIIMRGLRFVFITAPTICCITAHYPKAKDRDKTYGLAAQEIDIMLGRVKYNPIGLLEESVLFKLSRRTPRERESFAVYAILKDYAWASSR